MSQPAQVDPSRYENEYRDQQVAQARRQPHRGTSEHLPGQHEHGGFEMMLARSPDKFEEIKLAALRFRLIEPSLPNGGADAPVWEMHATRID
jgi:hypothetical protein